MTPEDAESVSAVLNKPGGYMTPETLRQDLSDHDGGQDDAWLDERPIPGHPATWRDGIDYFDKLKFIEPDDAWMDQPIREGLDYLRTQPATNVRFTFDNNVGDYQVTFDDGQIPTAATITPTNEPGQPTP